MPISIPIVSLMTPDNIIERKEVKNISKYALVGFFLFTLTLFYLYFFVRVLWRIGDEGTIVYGAQRVAEGSIPYRDFFEVMGPLSFYWLGLFFKIFGTKILVARGLLILTGATTAFLLFWLTRRLYNGNIDILPSIFYTIISIPLWPGNNHHWDSSLFALLALCSFLLWSDNNKKQYLIASGILTGLTSCIIQQKGFYIFLALIICQITCRYKKNTKNTKLIHIVIFSASYAGVGLLTLLFFHLVDGLDDLIYANLLWPISNYHNVNIVPYAHGLIEYHWSFWSAFFRELFPVCIAQLISAIFLAPLFLIAALPVLILLTLISSYWNTRKREKFFTSTTIPFWLVGWALWFSEVHRTDLMHLIYGSPVLLVIFFMNWQTNKYGKVKLISHISYCFIYFPLLFFGIFHVFLTSNIDHELQTRRGSILSSTEDTALNFLLENTNPNDSVFIYPYYPMYYFLANVTNPTRFSILMHNINTEEQFLETIASLEHRKVKYVLWDTVVDGINLKKWFPGYTQPDPKNLHLEHYLKSHYNLLDTKNGYRILMRIDA